MDLVNHWATKLAESTAPDEIDLAPDIAEAYIEGGEARAELFKQTDTSVAGGFGSTSGIAILPWIFRGLWAGASALLKFLTSDNTNNAVASLQGILDIHKQLKAPAEAKKQIQSMPNQAPYSHLKQFIETMRTELREAGLESDQADAITLRVVDTLLSDSQGAIQFIQQIASAPK